MEVLLLLLEVKRTGWGKLASNSKPVCDLASWCSNPAINIKHGFGMGFQLGSLPPLPSAQQSHPSPIGGVSCWPDSLSPLLTQFFSPSINHTNSRLGGKKKSVNPSVCPVGSGQSWSRFFPALLAGTQSPGGREIAGFLGPGDGGSPTAACLQGGATCQGCCRVTVRWIFSF